MVNLTIKLDELWKTGLSADYRREHHSITAWLEGCPETDHKSLSSEKTTQLINYRYGILKKRYLNKSFQEGYQSLIKRLSIIILNYPPIERKFKYSANHQQFIFSLTGQMLDYMLKHDPEVQKTLDWVGKCTHHPNLRAAFVLASLEEYFCQSVNHKPLLIHCLRHFLDQVRINNHNNFVVGL